MSYQVDELDKKFSKESSLYLSLSLCDLKMFHPSVQMISRFPTSSAHLNSYENDSLRSLLHDTTPAVD